MHAADEATTNRSASGLCVKYMYDMFKSYAVCYICSNFTAYVLLEHSGVVHEVHRQVI